MAAMDFSPQKRQRVQSTGAGEIIIEIGVYALESSYMLPEFDAGQKVYALNLKCDKRPSPLVKAEETLEAYLASGALPAFGSAVAELVPGWQLCVFCASSPIQ